MAFLNSGGTTPETRDELIMCVTAGRSSFKHSTNRDVGMGPSEQGFGAELSITLPNNNTPPEQVGAFTSVMYCND